MTHKNTQNILDSLLEIMRALRAPNGCPWDAQQTPESLTSFIMEEACELIDAIDEGNPELIQDELGDLLLQVVFQAQIFQERNQFDFHDVAAGITDKLVRRHPHVFDRNNTKVHAAELDKQWDRIKQSETTHNKTCLADHLPSKLPALQRAQKLISKVHRVGRQTELPIDDQKWRQQMNAPQETGESWLPNEESLGQALFYLVRKAHDANLDAEAALRKITQKAIRHLDKD